MTNHTTLAQLREMDVTEAASLPIDHLAMLLEAVAAQKADTRLLDDKLTDAMGRRYGDQASDARKAKGKDTGTVSLMDGDYVIRADLPKRVEWDTAKLADAVGRIKKWGENPDEFVVTKHVVSETKYNAWPSSIRAVFEPARTVGTGRPSYSVERRAA